MPHPHDPKDSIMRRTLKLAIAGLAVLATVGVANPAHAANGCYYSPVRDRIVCPKI
jgi:hypothetical protein